jgi:hypothetical protein
MVAGGSSGFFGTYSNHSLQFLTNSGTKLTLDASGNLGLGVTPSAWSSFTALQVQNLALWSVGGDDYSNYSSNMYFDGTNSRYISSQTASLYQQYRGSHQWYNAASGTAGATISFGSPKMQLFATGNLFIGASPSDAGYKLDVNGTGRFSGALSGTKVQFLAGSYGATYANNFTGDGTFAYGSSTAIRFTRFAYNSGDQPGVELGYDVTNNNGIIAGATQATGAGLDFWTFNGSSWASRFTIASTGAATFSSSIKTGIPATWDVAGAWKLGTYFATTVALNTSGYITVDIGGTLYYLALATPL